MKHTSYRGMQVDMDMLRFQNQHSVAIGNANMNARGDVLGRGGVVVKTREELLKEREVQMTKPDFNPQSQTSSASPEMDSVSFTNSGAKGFVDFTADDEPEATAEPEVQEAPAKRAPRKKD
jgi:hypothetical protein